MRRGVGSKKAEQRTGCAGAAEGHDAEAGVRRHRHGFSVVWNRLDSSIRPVQALCGWSSRTGHDSLSVDAFLNLLRLACLASLSIFYRTQNVCVLRDEFEFTYSMLIGSAAYILICIFARHIHTAQIRQSESCYRRFARLRAGIPNRSFGEVMV